MSIPVANGGSASQTVTRQISSAGADNMEVVVLALSENFAILYLSGDFRLVSAYVCVWDVGPCKDHTRGLIPRCHARAGIWCSMPVLDQAWTMTCTYPTFAHIIVSSLPFRLWFTWSKIHFQERIVLK